MGPAAGRPAAAAAPASAASQQEQQAGPGPGPGPAAGAAAAQVCAHTSSCAEIWHLRVCVLLRARAGSNAGCLSCPVQGLSLLASIKKSEAKSHSSGGCRLPRAQRRSEQAMRSRLSRQPRRQLCCPCSGRHRLRLPSQGCSSSSSSSSSSPGSQLCPLQLLRQGSRRSSTTRGQSSRRHLQVRRSV